MTSRNQALSARRPWRTILRRISPRRFADDRRGVTAVEFGLVAVPFLGLLLATFETGFVFINTIGLQQAVQTGARSMLTGNAQGNAAAVYNGAQFNATYVCPILPAFIHCSSLITDIRTATSFASADTTNTFYTNPSTMMFCPGSPGQIMIVRVIYPMPAYLTILLSSPTISRSYSGLVNNVPGNTGWKHLLMATIVFQTEPYNATNYNKASYNKPGNTTAVCQ